MKGRRRQLGGAKLMAGAGIEGDWAQLVMVGRGEEWMKEGARKNADERCGILQTHGRKAGSGVAAIVGIPQYQGEARNRPTY